MQEDQSRCFHMSCSRGLEKFNCFQIGPRVRRVFPFFHANREAVCLSFRQRKDELEQRMSSLQESRRELMVQLEGLMKLLKVTNTQPSRSLPSPQPPVSVPAAVGLSFPSLFRPEHVHLVYPCLCLTSSFPSSSFPSDSGCAVVLQDEEQRQAVSSPPLCWPFTVTFTSFTPAKRRPC